MPHSTISPTSGPRRVPFYPLSPKRRGARGGSHSSGPSETTGSRIPLVSAAGTTNRQRVEKLSRPSSTSFLIRLSLAKRRPNKGIREAADDVGISGGLSRRTLFLSHRSLSALSAPHLQPPSLKTHLPSTVFTVTYAQLVRFLSVSLPLLSSKISMLPPLARELYSGIPGIRLDNAPWLARYSALFYAVRDALRRRSRADKDDVP